MALKNIKWQNLSSGNSPNHYGLHTNARKPKWRTMIALLIVYGATFFNWQWIWGVFSLYWIIPDFFTGVTYFTEPVDRTNNPILYWLILITWLAFSVMMFFPSVSAS